MNHYYTLLGIPYGSDKDTVKKAFHKLAHIHHPDKGGDEAKFKQINEAYQFLMKQPEPQAQQHQQGFNPMYGHTIIFRWGSGGTGSTSTFYGNSI